MAAALAPSPATRKLDFDPKILGTGSSGSLTIGAATSADVLQLRISCWKRAPGLGR